MKLLNKAIDKSIPIPMYYQLKQHLLELIKNSNIGDPIPTESELCSHFQVSRPTVRQAIIELVNDGYVTRSAGKGTFITKPKVQRDFLLSLQSFNDEMRSHGKIPKTKVIEVCSTKADYTVGQKLGIEVGTDVVFLRRVRYADNEPLMVVNSFLPSIMVPGIETHTFEHTGLHVLLTDAYHYKITRALRSFEAIGIPETEASLLEVNIGAPALYVETLIYTSKEIPIEFSTAWYTGSNTKFTFELREQLL